MTISQISTKISPTLSHLKTEREKTENSNPKREHERKREGKIVGNLQEEGSWASTVAPAAYPPTIPNG
eukprot:579173-Amorphochlora_amoeboformis.AAC.1